MERLEQLVEQIFRTRTITREEQTQLMDIVMEDGKICPDEQVLIDRVWKGLAEGRLRAVN
ncbi:hypothetical protein PROH_13115 [Prochlorothrix hollandica PCC 9006 = CALU 1027]|uniref:Uncharacterized protein n=2 Tax=Prochlorothrix hollandica TaxID=1223 RepID=A0A0M2PWQ7_PROHO|nr:hypothetical protein PROH_13115 [Prochlorothrix hollandica PCC 9006 = CALU 1027]